jgi:hypothetical protein
MSDEAGGAEAHEGDDATDAAPVGAQATAIVDDLVAAILRGEFTVESITGAVEALGALEPFTEQDRLQQLQAWQRLCVEMAALLDGVDDAGSWRDQATMAATALERRYGADDAPYLRSRILLAEAVARIEAGEAVEAVIAGTVDAIAALPFAPEDEGERAPALIAVQALRTAHDFARAPHDDTRTEAVDFMVTTLRTVVAVQRMAGVSRSMVVHQLDFVRGQRVVVDAARGGHARALLVVLGSAILASPGSLPGLAPVLEALVEELVSLEATVADVAVAPLPFATRRDAMLRSFEAEAATAAVDDPMLHRWTAELQALLGEPGVDLEEHVATTDRFWAIVVAHSEGARRAMFERMRDSGRALLEGGSAPLDADDVDRALDAMRDRVTALVDAGEPLDVVGGEFGASLSEFMARAATSEALTEAGARAFVRRIPALLEALLPVVPEAQRQQMEDMHLAITQAFAPFGHGEVGAPAESEALEAGGAIRRMRMLVDTATDYTPDALTGPPWHRQVVAALPALVVPDVVADRAAAPCDAAEAEQLRRRFDVVRLRMQGAATEEQWIGQLRRGLRPWLVERRRFERRRHAMLVEPPYAPRDTDIDANLAHLCVAPALEPTLTEALAAIGMAPAAPFGVGDPTALRWHQLRRSAVAIVDWTAYDPARADPPGPLPDDRAARARIAAAAAPVARSAYEQGWALVLGTPVVTLARAGRALPFDVDVAPVALDGSDDDAMRVTLAVQGALLAEQREATGSETAPTLARLRALHARTPGAAATLDAVAAMPLDAMALVNAIDALSSSGTTGTTTLAFPAFPPAYPDPSAPPSVFHVTAFREWSRPCERALREACARAGVRYLIGHDRLDADILGAIWRDIATASLVVADVTHLNPNALLELGIAHAIGRPTVVLSRTPDVPVHVPALARVRVHDYDADPAGLDALGALLDRHLAAIVPAPAGDR